MPLTRLAVGRDVFYIERIGRAYKKFGMQTVTTTPAAVTFLERTFYVVSVLHTTIDRLLQTLDLLR